MLVWFVWIAANAESSRLNLDINIILQVASLNVDIQIEPTRFSIGCDPDEPDEHSEFLLENRQQFYNVMTAQLAAVPKDERHG